MYGHPIHVDVAKLLSDDLQHLDLIVQFYRAHPTTDVTFKLYASVSGAPRVHTDHAVSLGGKHVHS